MGIPTADGATVTVLVTAERGANLRFAVGGSVVHTAGSSGEEQPIAFTLADGRHRVAVTATDAAGNTSDAADFRVAVDATPPGMPGLAVAVGDAAGAETSMTLNGEDGADYVVRLSGPDEHTEEGTLSRGEVEHAWLLTNGDYTLSATLTDAVGNTSKTAKETFTVVLPAPAVPYLSIFSDPGAKPIEVAVAAEGAEAVVVSLLGRGTSKEETVELNRKQEGTVTFSAPDGRYRLEAVAVDFQRQQSPPAREGGVIVDTTAPILELDFLDDLLAAGSFAYRLQTEEGASVRVTSDTDALIAEFTAEDGWQEFSVDVPRGEHIIALSIIDAFGNEAAHEFTATVTSPLGVGDVVTLLVILAVLGGLGFGAFSLVRRGRTRKGNRVDGRLILPPPPVT